MSTLNEAKLPVLWQRPGCYWLFYQPPFCGQLSSCGWSAEALPPSVGSAQEQAFLLCIHTYKCTKIWSAHSLGKRKNISYTLKYVHACGNPHFSQIHTWFNPSLRHTGKWRREVTLGAHTAHKQATHKHTPTHAIWLQERRTVNVLDLWQCKFMPYGLKTTRNKWFLFDSMIKLK